MNLKAQIFRHGVLKSARVNFNVVSTNGQKRNQIVTGAVGLGVSLEARSLRGDRDGRRGDRRTRFIVDIAGETSSGLAMEGRSDHDCEYADEGGKEGFIESFSGQRIHRTETICGDLGAVHCHAPFEWNNFSSIAFREHRISKTCSMFLVA